MRFTALVAVSAAFVLPAVFVPNGPTRAANNSIDFTAAQAATGAKSYVQSCAACHGITLTGVTAPALAGAGSAIASQPISEVYAYVSQQMPMTAPGSLSKTQYVGIVAYLAQKNGHKPGSKPLTQAAVASGTSPIGSAP